MKTTPREELEKLLGIDWTQTENRWDRTVGEHKAFIIEHPVDFECKIFKGDKLVVAFPVWKNQSLKRCQHEGTLAFAIKSLDEYLNKY